MSTPHVQAVVVGDGQTNCYLVENRDTEEVLIVDPGAQGAAVMEAVGNRKPVAILLTHGHYDHIGGVDEVCAHFGVPVYLHSLDLPMLGDAALNVSERFAAQPFMVQTPALALEDGQTLLLGDMQITVIHTPGHTPGSCCFLLPEGGGQLLCGDTLFDGGYGRTDLPGGCFRDLKNSFRRLLALTPRMTAYPGHGPTTFAGREP